MTDPSCSLESATYRSLKWRLIPFLMACYVASYLDRVNVGFAKLHMLSDLHFSETAYGIGAGVFFIGYVLCGVPSNLMLHRFGARVWIAVIMVAWGLISGSMAFVKTPAQFYVLRLLLGAAEAGFNPGVILYLTHWFPNARRTRMVSLFQSAVPLSGLIGGALSGWILDHLRGQYGFAAWQWLFLVEALPALALGVAVWFYLDAGIDRARWLTAAQKELLVTALARDEATRERVPLRTILTDWRVWRLSILALGLVIGLYAVSFWTPTLLVEAGAGSATEVGLLSTIPNLLAIPAMLMLARSSDLTAERRLHVALSAFAGSAGLVLCTVAGHNVVMEVCALSLATVGLMSAIPVQWSFVTGLLGGAGGAAAIGLLNSVSNLGGLISAPLIGWLKDTTGSVHLGLVAISCCALGSAILALSLPARLVSR
jgi:MFS family permease